MFRPGRRQPIAASRERDRYGLPFAVVAARHTPAGLAAMLIAQATVLEVVKEASGKMQDPNYSAVMVGGFVQTQGPAAHYISAHAAELGGAEGVVNTIFHAAVIALCFQRGNRRSVRNIRFDELDHVASGDREATLRSQQPAVLDYIEINVEVPAMKQVLTLLALAMELVS